MNEPTLGMIHEGVFYFVANSPWGAYDKENQLIEEKLKPVEIWMYKIED